MQKETNYNKVVNIADDGEITVLDYTFVYSTDFKGATGHTFYPISKAQYKSQTTLKAIEERLRDSVNEEDIPMEFRAGETRIYKNPFRRWAKAIIENNEAEEFIFDMSYSELWDYLREVTGLNDKDAYIFECTGGGRCFNADFNGNVNPELSSIIREFETK